MWSNRAVKFDMQVGYTFIHNGEHHTVIGVYDDKIHCRVQGIGSYYMTYAYFQTTNHFKSRHGLKKGVGIVK